MLIYGCLVSHTTLLQHYPMPEYTNDQAEYVDYLNFILPTDLSIYSDSNCNLHLNMLREHKSYWNINEITNTNSNVFKQVAKQLNLNTTPRLYSV